MVTGSPCGLWGGVDLLGRVPGLRLAQWEPDRERTAVSTGRVDSHSCPVLTQRGHPSSVQGPADALGAEMAGSSSPGTHLPPTALLGVTSSSLALGEHHLWGDGPWRAGM